MADDTIELMPGVPWASTAELNRLLRQQGLCLAVAQAAVFDEIARAIPLERNDEDALIHTWLERQDLTDDDALTAWLQRKGWSQDDLCYFATKGYRLELFKQRLFDSEVELRFLERKLDLDQVTYSLIRVREQHLAEELYHRLADDGDDFADIASAFSQGPEQASGGRIGPVPLSQAHETVAELLRISRPGQLWPPFFLVNIWLIVRLDVHQPARLDEDVRRTMRDDLFEDWIERRVEQLLAGETPPPLLNHLLTSNEAPAGATAE